MTKDLLAGVGLALTVAGLEISAHAQAAITAVDEKLVGTCMAMNTAAMKKDHRCTGLMRRMNVSQREAADIRSCRAMTTDVLLKDATCVELVDKHPDLMHAGSAAVRVDPPVTTAN